jgi:hypothetical protein
MGPGVESTIRIQDLGYMQGSRSGMQDLEPRLQDLRHPGCRVRRARGTGSRTQGLRSQAWDQGLGSGFRIPGAGCDERGAGSRTQDPKHGVTDLGTRVNGL